MIARVYGLTNEAQKRYLTKCVGDLFFFLLIAFSRIAWLHKFMPVSFLIRNDFFQQLLPNQAVARQRGWLLRSVPLCVCDRKLRCARLLW